MMKETTSEKLAKPSTDLGILIGLLLTDGCVASEGKVILINKSGTRRCKNTTGYVFSRWFCDNLSKMGEKKKKVSTKKKSETSIQTSKTKRTNIIPSSRVLAV